MKTPKEYFIQQKHFEQFVQEFVEKHEQPKEEDIERFIEKIKIMEQFTIDDKKRFYILFDHSKFYPAYFSANIEREAGFTVKHLISQGLFFLFKRIHWKQLFFPYKMHKWGTKFQKLIGLKVPVNSFEVWICGVQFRDRWNKWRTGILKQKILTCTTENKPLLSFVEVEEITAIYKVNCIWYRLSCDVEGKKVVRAYFSNGPKKEYADILSPREIEILQLAAQQKNNQEISEVLDISKNTVERHRKNMIARVGVKDMTALIRIGQIVKLV